MNNEQFRRLVLDKPGKRADSNDNDNAQSHAGNDLVSSKPSPAGAILGSRLRASIPMTPRSIRGNSSSRNNSNAEFARQLAEQRREEMQPPPTKRFKSSAAPKGTKLASGYQDRTALRRQQEEGGGGGGGGGHDDIRKDEEDGVEARLKALEEMMKLGQIDHATFEKLRRDIGVGGDLGSTHLVKGLDWDLLKRVKAGEDLDKKEEEEEEEDEQVDRENVEDVDDELDRALEQQGDKAPAPKEKKVKKGNLAMPPPSAIQGKMSRDEILRRLKASRAAAAPESAPPESTLSAKFKKIKDDNKPDKKRWVETDPNGRRKEILLITDAEGKTKRKVRWLDKEDVAAKANTVDSNGLLLPDQDAKPLGMEVPAAVAAKMAAEAAAAAAAEAEDDDIFAGVGTDYNPLADLDEDDSEDDEAEDRPLETKPAKEASRAEPPSTTVAGQQQQTRRNYFNDRTTEEDVDSRNKPLTSDPTLLAAIKRAAALRQSSPSGHIDDVDGEDSADLDPEKLAHRKKFFEEARRRDAQDALDLDYGFGSSRIEDEEDEEGPTFDAAGGQRGGSNKRKRGPKKRKGDKDSASDVLRVMEGRKK